MLRADLPYFLYAYIVVKENVTVTDPDNAKRNKSIAFKNNAPFINCIYKINSLQIDSAEDLDVVIPIYNLLEQSKNWSKTTGSLRNYHRDEPSNRLSSNSESFKYQTSITGKTYNAGSDEDGHDAKKVGKNKVGKNKAVPLMKIAIPLAKNALASLGITAAVSAIEAAIQKTKKTRFWKNNFNNFK